MQNKSFLEIEREYELELEKILKTIKEGKSKLVLLQFPDGLKPYSTVIADGIEKKAGCKCLIWLGDCFGACDVPDVSNLKQKIDLIVQFGHSAWNYK
ncbi:MAG: diphthamide synthesis protein [Nanoarchaeota archaeon]|nr:diphthamide synthesis protein [Nanoarchaeota archaeon]